MNEAERETVGANPWAWTGAGLALGATAFMYFYPGLLADLIVSPSENATREHVEGGLDRTLLGVSLLLVSHSATFFYFGIRQIQVARRASEEGRFPPQGVRLLLPIRVVRDQRCEQLVFYYRFVGACNLVVAFAALGAASRVYF